MTTTSTPDPRRRLVVVGVLAGAAALVLVAIVLALVVFRPPHAGVIESPSPSASTSPTAGASETARPSSDPSAAPSTELGTAFAPPTRPDVHPLPPIWVVVSVNGLNVRAGPGPEHDTVGSLDAGDLARIIEGPAGEPAGWYQLAADGVIGWASIGPEDGRYFVATPTPWLVPGARTLSGIVSNGSGYLAYGSDLAAQEFPPYEGWPASTWYLMSDDGVTWMESSAQVPPPGAGLSAAGNEDGWVVVNSHMMGNVPTWSTDGRSWEWAQIGGRPSSVAVGPAGWVISGVDDNGVSAAWWSATGQSWAKVELPAEDHPGQHVDASDSGFVIFDRQPATRIFLSANGRDWTDVDLPDAWGHTFVHDVEVIGSRILLVTAAAGEASHLHDGTLSGGTVTWQDDRTPFGDSVIDGIGSGPDGLLAAGWDVRTLAPVIWSSADGADWQQHELDALAFGGAVPSAPVHGAAGWATVGLGADPGEPGPAVWTSPDGRTWTQATAPMGAPVPEPQCPDPSEVKLIHLAYLGDRAYDCFGDQPLTVRGWVPIEEGRGGCCYPVPEPAWLGMVIPPQLLMPGEDANASFAATIGVHLAPSVESDDFPDQAWVEVTGHYGDARSSECVLRPHGFFANPPITVAEAIDTCLRNFVVDQVSVVPGP